MCCKMETWEEIQQMLRKHLNEVKSEDEMWNFINNTTEKFKLELDNKMLEEENWCHCGKRKKADNLDTCEECR